MFGGGRGGRGVARRVIVAHGLRVIVCNMFCFSFCFHFDLFIIKIMLEPRPMWRDYLLYCNECDVLFER